MKDAGDASRAAASRRSVERRGSGRAREARERARRELERERRGISDGEALEEKCARVVMIWRNLYASLETSAVETEVEDEVDVAKTRNAFDGVLRELSVGFSRARRNGDSTQAWSPPSAFERKTLKYWVHPRDVVPLQLEILKRLPILEYREDETRGEVQKVGANDSAESDESASGDRSLVTSVYLDNEHFDVYRSRLVREQGATLVRCRWYGSDRVDNVFIERKTHHESWSEEKSVKERYMTSREYAAALLNGFMPAFIERSTVNKKCQTLANEVYIREIQGRKIRPVLATTYRRTAFQRSDGNAIRVSIDSDLRWSDVRENASCAVSRATREGYSAPFEYAVLEIKLACAESEGVPEWIEDIVSSFELTQVYKFSKFLHGCAVYFPLEVLRTVPHWFARSTTNGSHATGRDSFVPDMERTESSSSFAEMIRAVATVVKLRKQDRLSSKGEDIGASADVEAPAARMLAPRFVPVKVEPKTFFANERTLLQWLSMSILLLFLALGLMAIGRENRASVVPFGDASSASAMSGHPFAGAICGIIIAPISIMFMVYALWTYMIRAQRIARREPSTRYDDICGPVALVTILTLVATIAVALSAMSIDWNDIRYERP